MKLKLNGEFSLEEILQQFEDAKKDKRPKNLDMLVDSLKELVCYETDSFVTVKKQRGCICTYEQPTLALSEGLYAISILKQLAYVLNDMEDTLKVGEHDIFYIYYETGNNRFAINYRQSLVNHPLSFKRKEDAKFVLENWKDTLEKAKLFI